MKISTVLLILLLVAGGIAINYQYQRNQPLQINHLQIDSDVSPITDILPEGRYVLCSLKEEDGDAPCVTMFKKDLE